MYLEKLDQLEGKLNVQLKDKYASPKIQDMIDEANEDFNVWDNMLNVVM